MLPMQPKKLTDVDATLGDIGLLNLDDDTLGNIFCHLSSARDIVRFAGSCRRLKDVLKRARRSWPAPKRGRCSCSAGTRTA